MPSVSRLSITPVKGVALTHPDEVELTHRGVPENRRFYLVDETGKRWSGLRDGPLFGVRAETDAAASHLRLEFPDGTVVDGPVALGEQVVTGFFAHSSAGRFVEGPASGA